LTNELILIIVEESSNQHSVFTKNCCKVQNTMFLYFCITLVKF